MARAPARTQPGAFAPGLDLDSYIAEVEGIRRQSEGDLCGAGEHALKTLDLFLANLAALLGYENERAGMHDSIQYLERLGGRAQSIAAQAERFRATRNALAHNPDLMLRPESALRIINAVEKIVRSAARTAYEMARRPVASVSASEQAAVARDRMLARGVGQLAVVDDRGKLVDLLTYRDIVAAEARKEIDGQGQQPTVRHVIETRDHLAVAPVGRDWSIGQISEALSVEEVAAAVVTENGQIGETPLGIITRGDILKLR
ncbi:hypothetical protein BH23CHL2_BH23CHL2_28950 [soil metagenome]